MTSKLRIFGSLLPDHWSEFEQCAAEAFTFIQTHKVSLNLAVSGDICASSVSIPADIESPEAIERLLWANWYDAGPKTTKFSYKSLPETHRERIAEKEAKAKEASPMIAADGRKAGTCPQCGLPTVRYVETMGVCPFFACGRCGWNNLR